MNETGTLLLTDTTPSLALAVARAYPRIAVKALEEHVPDVRSASRTFCFVDWLLPDISGLEMCRRLRDRPETAYSHITMVLEEDDGDSRRRALRAGADDYIAGPLTPDSLVRRMALYLSGSAGGGLPQRLMHGDLVVDLMARQVRWRGQPIILRPNEFALLVHFVEHQDRVFSRSSLIATLGKDDNAIDERTVDVWIGRLRRALKAQGAPDPLRTVRSMGYVLDGIEEHDWRRAG